MGNKKQWAWFIAGMQGLNFILCLGNVLLDVSLGGSALTVVWAAMTVLWAAALGQSIYLWPGRKRLRIRFGGTAGGLVVGARDTTEQIARDLKNLSAMIEVAPDYQCADTTPSFPGHGFASYRCTKHAGHRGHHVITNAAGVTWEWPNTSEEPHA